MIFVLWSHKELFDDKSSFNVHMYPMFAACFLNAFTQPFGVWNHHIRILVVAVVLSRIVGAFLVFFFFWSLAGAWLLNITLLRAHAR